MWRPGRPARAFAQRGGGAFRGRIASRDSTLADISPYKPPGPQATWSHGLFACCAEPRSVSPLCCLSHCCCGGVCAWASVAGALHVPRVEDVVAAVGLGQVASDLGARLSRANDGAGAVVQLLALFYIAYARAVGRVEVAKHLGHAHVPSLPEACFITLCCAPCASVQEIDTLAAAYLQIQTTVSTDPQGVEVVYACDILPQGLSCCCRCCYMTDTRQRSTGLLPLPPSPSSFGAHAPPLLLTMHRV